MTNPTPSELEDFLSERILFELERGRPGWDAPHTKSVVSKIKQIMDNNPQLDLDRNVMIISAFAHDWGYADLFEHGKPVSWKDIGEKKVVHMRLSAEKLEKLLSDPFFDFLTNEQKDRAVHLVSIHDRLDRLTAPDELVLMEADTLGALDPTGSKPTFDDEKNKKYIAFTKKARLPKFITDYGKKEAERLIKERENYYRGLSDGSDFSK